MIETAEIAPRARGGHRREHVGIGVLLDLRIPAIEAVREARLIRIDRRAERYYGAPQFERGGRDDRVDPRKCAVVGLARLVLAEGYRQEVAARRDRQVD